MRPLNSGQPSMQRGLGEKRATRRPQYANCIQRVGHSGAPAGFR